MGINYGRILIMGNAGFIPSTVVLVPMEGLGNARHSCGRRKRQMNSRWAQGFTWRVLGGLGMPVCPVEAFRLQCFRISGFRAIGGVGVLMFLNSVCLAGWSKATMSFSSSAFTSQAPVYLKNMVEGMQVATACSA